MRIFICFKKGMQNLLRRVYINVHIYVLALRICVFSMQYTCLDCVTHKHTNYTYIGQEFGVPGFNKYGGKKNIYICVTKKNVRVRTTNACVKKNRICDILYI